LTEARDWWAPGQSSTHVVGKKCLGIRSAVPRGRTECVPPRKPPFPSSPGFRRKAFLASLGDLAEGRAPHARKEGIALNRMSPLFGHHPLADPSVRVTCPGLRLARIRGRGDRAPPRKSPFPSSPGFPREAMLPWMVPPAEGRAPHARK